jgi:hypothetical protein
MIPSIDVELLEETEGSIKILRAGRSLSMRTLLVPGLQKLAIALASARDRTSKFTTAPVVQERPRHVNCPLARRSLSLNLQAQQRETAAAAVS